MLNKSILCENQTGLPTTQHLKKVYNLTVSSCTHHVFIEERYFIFVDDSFYITIQTCFYEMSLIIQSAIHCETSRHHRWVFKRLLSHRFRFFSTELLSRYSDLKRKIFCGTGPADLFHFILFRFCAKWRNRSQTKNHRQAMKSPNRTRNKCIIRCSDSQVFIIF